jgi:hypothetical protein
MSKSETFNQFNFSPDSGYPVFVLMLDMYFKSSLPEKSVKLFEQIKSRFKSTHAIYAQMVRNLAYAGRWPDSLRILRGEG